MAKVFGLPLPPPFKGQNDQLPVFSITNPHAERLENLTTKNGTLNLRRGNTRFFSGAVLYLAKNIVHYNESTLLVMFEELPGVAFRWYNLHTGVPVLSNSLAWGGDDEIHTLMFNKYLFYFGETTLTLAGTGIPYYNGTAWGLAAYTGFTSALAGGNVYKNRAYFIYRGFSKYAYSQVDAISGAVTNVDLSSVISSVANLYGIRSISMSENVTQENVQAFLFQGGEVLVYSGSYPASADWRIVSRFEISPIVYINSIVDAKGDSFVLCETEILSLRNLFTGGYSKESETGIGAAIKNRWSQIIRVLKAGSAPLYYIKGVYDQAKDRLVITMPWYVNPITEAIQYKPFQLIYDFSLGGWVEFFQDQLSGNLARTVSATFHNGSVYIAVNNEDTLSARVMSLETGSSFVDQDCFTTTDTAPINFKWKSAPYPVSKFGVIKTQGLEVIMQSDQNSITNWKLIGDLGAQETTAQKVPAINGTNIVKTFINMGIESNIVQSEMSGASTTGSTGLTIYATNLWVTPSEGLER